MTDQAPKTFEQLSQEYTMLCAQIGDRIFKVKLIEKELKDLESKADEINQLALAAKMKQPLEAVPAQEEVQAPQA